MLDNKELLSYIAMCIRMKLRKDQKSTLMDERVKYRIKQGETALREVNQRIKELENESQSN